MKLLPLDTMPTDGPYGAILKEIKDTLQALYAEWTARVFYMGGVTSEYEPTSRLVARRLLPATRVPVPFEDLRHGREKFCDPDYEPPVDPLAIARDLMMLALLLLYDEDPPVVSLAAAGLKLQWAAAM